MPLLRVCNDDISSPNLMLWLMFPFVELDPRIFISTAFQHGIEIVHGHSLGIVLDLRGRSPL